MHRAHLRLVLALAAGLVVASAFGSTPARAAEGRVEVEGATVRWDDGLERLGQRAATALSGVRTRIAHRLGWTYGGPPVEVVVVQGRERMNQVARAQVPAWAVGIAISSRSLIVIRSDLLARGFGGGVVPVLRHEWVHLTWGWRAGDKRRRLPLWAEEGIAEELGGGVSVDAGAALDLAVTFDRLLPFGTLERAFPAEAKEADLAYKQSRSWIRHLAAAVGWETIQALLSGLLEEKPEAFPGETPFEREIWDKTGRTVSSWHASWRRELEEQAVPWYHLLLRDFQGLLIAALAAVGAVAAIVLFRRRRRQIAALPDESPPPGSSG